MQTDKRWYVLWVHTGAEREIYNKIRACPMIDDVLLPELYRWYRQGGEWEKRKALAFPSYLFIQCNMGSTLYHLLRQTDKVLGWLGKDGCWPEIVPDEQMLPVLAISSGENPASYLKDISIDRHKRRGKGILHLVGTEQTITFAIDPKQSGSAQVDERPVMGMDEQTEET